MLNSEQPKSFGHSGCNRGKTDSHSVRNQLFLRVESTTGFLVYKVVAKLSYLVANIGGHMTTLLPPIVRSMTKQTSKFGECIFPTRVALVCLKFILSFIKFSSLVTKLWLICGF